MHRRPVIGLTLLALLVPAFAADAADRSKKGIWGPVRVDGVSQFPIYQELGAGVYDTSFSWADVAGRRPKHARDPNDPAYTWPSGLDDAAAEAQRYGIRLAVMVKGSPRWANGGKPQNWAPRRPRDYANFLAAAATRYRSVRYWIVWGEPTRRANFRPLPTTAWDKPLTRVQKAPPHRYARLLDAAYGAIKRANPRALVVGGNSFTGGDIGPRNWIANLELPSGRPPRMDLYGHNPFGIRRPDLSERPLVPGTADFCDLDDLARWIDRYLGRAPGGKRIDLWLGEYALATQPSEFAFYVDERTQASWLRSALRITRRLDRIATLNWLTLRDAPAAERGHYFISFGLIAMDGRRKPSFDAFKNG